MGTPTLKAASKGLTSKIQYYSSYLSGVVQRRARARIELGLTCGAKELLMLEVPSVFDA